MKAKTHIVGEKEFRKSLGVHSKKVNDRTRAALQAGAFKILNEADHQIISMGAIVTGHMKSSIHLETKITRDEARVFVGTNVEYAPHVEYGGKPFLRTAFENKADEAEKKIIDTLDKLLRDL